MILIKINAAPILKAYRLNRRLYHRLFQFRNPPTFWDILVRLSRRKYLSNKDKALSQVIGYFLLTIRSFAQILKIYKL